MTRDDQWWLRAAPTMESFYGTPVRVFAASDEAAARKWLIESPPEPATVSFLPTSDGALVGVCVTGRLRDVDYDDLKAELTQRLPESGKLRMLVIVDEHFRGWTPKAFLDDLSFAFSPWNRRFERLVLVSGPGFVRWCVEHFPAAMMPYQIRAFLPGDQESAWESLREPA